MFLFNGIQQLERLDKLPIGIEDDEAEELLKISDADVYLKTRKRDKAREYKATKEEAEALDKRFVSSLSEIQVHFHFKVSPLVHSSSSLVFSLICICSFLYLHMLCPLIFPTYGVFF